MLLTWTELETKPEQLSKQVYIPTRQGSIQAEMLASARRYGRIAYLLNGGLHDLAAELETGHPVLVLQNLGLDWLPRWHYAVVTGLDLERQSVRLHSGITQDYQLNLTTFLKTWDRAENWAAVILKPGELPASAKPRSYLYTLLDTQNSLNRSSALESDTQNFESAIESAYLSAIEK